MYNKTKLKSWIKKGIKNYKIRLSENKEYMTDGYIILKVDLLIFDILADLNVDLEKLPSFNSDDTIKQGDRDIKDTKLIHSDFNYRIFKSDEDLIVMNQKFIDLFKNINNMSLKGGSSIYPITFIKDNVVVAHMCPIRTEEFEYTIDNFK